MISPRTDLTYARPIAVSWAPAPPEGEVVVEIGPGRGDFLFHLARTQPETHCIGIEIRWLRTHKLLQRRNGLSNLSVVWGDAREVLPRLSQRHRIRAIYIQFPDPWPKRRHSGNRLMQSDFLRACVAALQPDGELWFTTDDCSYAEWTAQRVAQQPELVSCFPHPIVTTCPDAFTTYFAKKWATLGRTTYYQRYRKIDIIPCESDSGILGGY